MHENRETSGVSRPCRGQDRSEKMQNRTSDMYASEESDHAIVPMNQPNNEGQLSAEVGEGRAQTEENIAESHMSATQSVGNFGDGEPWYEVAYGVAARADFGRVR
jgi:hypothetical protein